MSNAGWLGLGKLGLPCAAALASCGHKVYGYDPVPGPAAPGVERVSLAEVVTATDGIVLVAVQTPHDPSYGGERPMPGEPRDFDYAALVQAVRGLAAEAKTQGRELTAVVISTVLPGTTRTRLLPLLRGSRVRLVYGPYFTATGSEEQDFADPEFQLLGADDEDAAAEVTALYRTVHGRPVRVVSIESAELAKVAYNVAVSMKIAYANMVAQMCDATGADADEVTGTLALATRRLLSPAYLTAGMGDGGSCHPRDLMAMSWLARKTGAADLPGFLARAREDQSAWLARLVKAQHDLTGHPVVVLGKAFKPGTAQVNGSAALLLAAHLKELGVSPTAWDPVTGDRAAKFRAPRVFVVATAHPQFTSLDIPPGSVVIDPHGFMPPRPGVTLITPGRKK